MGKKFLVVKHKENPFLEGLTVSTKGKRVTINTLGGDASKQIVIDQNTGEVKGTHVVAYKQVDDEEFIKLFTGNLALTFDLNQAGRKVLDMVLYTMQATAISKDEIYIDENIREAFAKQYKVSLAKSTMYRGIENLIDRKIIAKCVKTNIYYINPSLVFNGDRVAFTTLIERKKRKQKDPDENKKHKENK